MSWKLAAGIPVAILVLILLAVLLIALTDNALGLLEDPNNALAAYLVVFLLVFGDAVIAVLPGETTVNVASVLASQGDLLDPLPIVLAAGLGATLGDNTLYWIARSTPWVRKRVAELQKDERMEKAFRLLGRRASLLILFCRYLPFVRWAITASMGATRMPWGRYLLLSSVGDMVWGAYTVLVAYTIGSALEEYPIASMVIAGASSGVLVALVYMLESRRRNRKQPSDAKSDQ